MPLPIILLFLLPLLNACSLTSNQPEVTARKRGQILNNQTAPVAIQETPDAPEEEEELVYGMEITWDIPDETVDGYIIYSGENPDNLDSELHLRLSDLKIVNRKYYSYTIAPVDPDKTLYFAIASKKGESVSEKSEPQELNRPEARF